MVPVVPMALTKCVIAPAGLLPDFGAGGFVVDARVVGVGKLVQHPALAIALHLLGQITGVLHAAALGREDELGAKGLHGLRALDGQVLGHDQASCGSP